MKKFKSSCSAIPPEDESYDDFKRRFKWTESSFPMSMTVLDLQVMHEAITHWDWILTFECDVWETEWVKNFIITIQSVDGSSELEKLKEYLLFNWGISELWVDIVKLMLVDHGACLNMSLSFLFLWSFSVTAQIPF